MFLVRGILAILFGIAALLMPGIALVVLVALFGAYALVNGVILWHRLPTACTACRAGTTEPAKPGCSVSGVYGRLMNTPSTL